MNGVLPASFSTPIALDFASYVCQHFLRFFVRQLIYNSRHLGYSPRPCSLPHFSSLHFLATACCFLFYGFRRPVSLTFFLRRTPALKKLNMVHCHRLFVCPMDSFLKGKKESWDFVLPFSLLPVSCVQHACFCVFVKTMLFPPMVLVRAGARDYYSSLPPPHPRFFCSNPPFPLPPGVHASESLVCLLFKFSAPRPTFHPLFQPLSFKVLLPSPYFHRFILD